MYDAASTSPFAGETTMEIQGRWIEWKRRSESPSERPAPYVPEPPPMPQPVFHHQRYDAVMRRMQQAAKQTGSYTSVSS